MIDCVGGFGRLEDDKVTGHLALLERHLEFDLGLARCFKDFTASWQEAGELEVVAQDDVRGETFYLYLKPLGPGHLHLKHYEVHAVAWMCEADLWRTTS